MKSVLVAICIVAVAGVAGWFITHRDGLAASTAEGGGAMASGRDVPLVVVAPVTSRMLEDSVEAIGTALANESVTLTAKVTDTVRRVNFEDGDYVEAGTVLVELTNQEEEALLAEARANLDDAERQLRRLEEITAQGLAPASGLDTARSQAAASQARLDGIVARLSDRLIRAPFSGALGFRTVSPGTLVTPNTPITTLDDISIIKLDFTVPETFLSVMKPGNRVYARSASWGAREFEGEVRTVGSRVDPVTRAVTVRAHIPNEDRALRPGMLLTLRVVMAQRQALVVPESAVFQIADQAYVYRVGPDNIARRVEIEIGSRRFGVVEVAAGLSEGELVVSEGIVKLRDGTPVRIARDEPEVSGLMTSGPVVSGARS